MTVSPAVRVGIIVFLFVALFSAVYWFLTGYGLRRATYPLTVVFDNAGGLIDGSEVRMAGVRIGLVEKPTLSRDQRALVPLLINQKYKIPKGSRFVLRVGVLISDKYVDIVPNRDVRTYLRPGAQVRGEVPPSVEDLIPKAKRLVESLTETSESFNELIGNPEYQARLNRALANIESATFSLDRTMGVIERVVASEQDAIRETVDNVELASRKILGVSREIEAFARQGGLQENLGGTLASARRATESLERTTASLETLVTAPEFQRDVRETVSEAREAVKEAREVLDRVGQIFGRGPGISARIPTHETSLDALFEPEDGSFRATLTANIPTGRDTYLNLGIFDAGGSNKFILQPAQSVDSRFDFRYGIYASRLGLGLDYAFSSRTYGSLNLFDPEDPTLNFQAGYNVADDWGVLLGVDDLLGDNKLTLGARLTK